jgi:hypothetical protein
MTSSEKVQVEGQICAGEHKQGAAKSCRLTESKNQGPFATLGWVASPVVTSVVSLGKTSNRQDSDRSGYLRRWGNSSKDSRTGDVEICDL